MHQYFRAAQRSIRHAAHCLGGSADLGSAAPAAAAAAAGGLLRLLQTGLPLWRHAPQAAACFTSAASGAAAAAAEGGIEPGRGRRVAVGISGGVDSAVAAMLLQQQGYDVVGVFMRNWDEGEETGNQNCSVERDLRDASAVCRRLRIPLHEADFVSAYWNQVFSEFLVQCGRGLTPNPDLACNRHIKFDALLRFAGDLGAELVATGHYARLAPSGPGAAAVPALLRGADHRKDQTYFLASVQPSALRRVLFPVGHLQKPEVRRLAAEAGLAPAEKRSSAGICFIGRRNFADFLAQYIPVVPGRYVDVDTGAELGPCPDLQAVTHGQRPGIGGAPGRVYAVGKDVVGGVVYVAAGRDHPALLSRTALLRTPHWLSAQHAQQLADRGSLRCQYKARYGQEPRSCTVHVLDRGAAQAVAQAAAAVAAAQAPSSSSSSSSGSGDGQPSGEAAPTLSPPFAAASSAAAEAAAALGFSASAYCRLQLEDSAILPSYLVVRFDEPASAITPQQAFVLYDGEQCLGTALIALPGRTLHEEAAPAQGSARCATVP